MCVAHLVTLPGAGEGAILCDIFLSPLRHTTEKVSYAVLPSGYLLMMGEAGKSCRHEKPI